MVTWHLLPSGCRPDEWDPLLLRSQDRSVFQSHAWGEYRRTRGWEPRRFVARGAGGTVVAMAQLLKQSRLGFLRLCWCPGGPVLRFPDSPPAATAELLRSLCQAAGTGPAHLRFDCYLPQEPAVAFAFRQVCRRSFSPINGGFSLVTDLTLPPGELLARMTRKHRYYLKKALETDLEWSAGNDPRRVQELVTLHTEMIVGKELSSLCADAEETAALCATLGPEALIFTGYRERRPVTSCLVLLFGGKAFYLMAATGAEGRASGAAYAMVHHLFLHLRERGITHFDFGGIDPRSEAAAGVNHFKKGFGGELVQYLGEWEWSSSEPLRWLVNASIWWRGRRLEREQARLLRRKRDE